MLVAFQKHDQRGRLWVRMRRCNLKGAVKMAVFFVLVELIYLRVQ